MIHSPRVWLCPGAPGTPEQSRAVEQLGEALKTYRPAAKLITETPDGAENAAAFLDAQQPDIVLALFAPLPHQIVDAITARNLPLVLIHPQAEPAAQPRPFWRRFGRHARPLAPYARVLVPDATARLNALRRGALPETVVITGPLTETLHPPPANEAELTQQAAALGGRQCWYAAAIPEAEEQAVIAAHLAVLGQSHRALLILEPADPRRAAELAADCEAAGIHAGLRSDLDAPDFDHQALILDDPGEAGLWYRLAPISLMGGSFSGDDRTARHPFEAASLGSAILHGPKICHHRQAWQMLMRAQATCLVPQPDQLAKKLLDLMTPAKAATLARHAWEVSTRGAEIANQIIMAALALIDPAMGPTKVSKQ